MPQPRKSAPRVVLGRLASSALATTARTIRDITPKWSSLRRLRARKLELLSRFAFFFCPAIALGFHYAERITALPLEHVKVAQSFVPEELIIAYMVAVPYVLGCAIFDLACPPDVVAHSDIESYRRYIEKLRGRPAKLGGVVAALKEQFGLNDEESKRVLSSVVKRAIGEELAPEAGWLNLNRQRTFWRLLVLSLFSISIGLSLFVIAWTAPRQVFHVRSPSQVLEYLLGYDALNSAGQLATPGGLAQRDGVRVAS